MANPQTKIRTASNSSNSSEKPAASFRARLRASILLLALIGVSVYAVRQYLWRQQLNSVQQLLDMHALKSATEAVQEIEQKWGKSAETHFARARLARYRGKEDEFSNQINRAALQGVSASRVKHEENLFLAQIGRLEALPGSWGDLLASTEEKLSESAAALLDGIILTRNFPAAISIVDMWAKAEPDSYLVDFYRGKIARYEEKADDAKRFYETAFEKNKEYYPLLQELGEINFVTLSPKKGIPLLEKAMEEDPDNSSLKTALAESYLATDRFEEAAELVEPFVSPNDKNSDARNMLGRAFLGMGQNQKAIDVLLPIQQAWPEDIDSNRNLATAYNLIGNEERAEFHDQASRRGLKRTEDIYARRSRVQSRPNDPELYYSVGHDLLDCVSRVEAFKCFKIACD